MVGTKNYFFFFPNTALWTERDRASRTNTTNRKTYSLGGLPVEEFIKNKLEQDHLSIDEFEKYALELADPENKEESWVAQAFPFSDIKQIKMQINFFFATITINKTDQRIKGWKPVFLKVGKQKKAIMNPIIKNILAVIAGWLSGSIINMALISTGHKLLPIEGLDPNDMSAFAEVMPTLEFEYFIFPFLAHALGTLVGAAIASVYFIPYTNRNSSMSSEASKICLFSPLIGTRISNKP